MKIIYKRGDILEAGEKFICHGCNARGKMASGIADQIRKKRPVAYEAYMAEFEKNGLPLGKTIWAGDADGWIINAITQENYGRDAPLGVVYFSYAAVELAVNDINRVAAESQRDGTEANIKYGRIETVAFPLIGAGLAGGDWSLISNIIESKSTSFQPLVYKL